MRVLTLNSWWRRRTAGVLACGLLLIWAPAVVAGDIGMTFVKTIGQSSPEIPLLTGGGRLSVDDKGCLYAGTPGANSYLQKISPTGRVIWRADDTHCAYTGTAVDDRYVYGCGIGYYGYGHLLRRKKASGAIPPGWNYVWTKPTDVVNGVRGFASPGALLVDNAYLYILDLGNGTLRRLDKESGAEKPFAAPIAVPNANDTAFSAAGTLLVLTPAGVAEFDRATGKPLRPQFVTGLRGACALALNRKTGTLYIGEGGTSENPVNKIRVFSSSTGEYTGMTLGRGGEWQGPWSPEAFAFSCGAADIACDAAGGFWANCFGARMGYLGLLVHFSAAGKPDVTLLAVGGQGIAVDGDLHITQGGNYQFSWDGRLRWTSGLIGTGKPDQYPTTVSYWVMQPVYADTRRVIILNSSGSALFTLKADTGENGGRGMGLPGGSLRGYCAAGQQLYLAIGDTIYRTTADLPPLDRFLDLPEPVKTRGLTGLSVRDDGQVVYLSAGSGAEARVYAFPRTGGTPIWEAKAGALFARYRGMLLAANPGGAGILALSADDGALSTIFNIGSVSGLAIGSRDGVDYLCAAGQNQVRVYRIAAAE